ncbi:uncharacterized protein LOC126884741 [Diabrotica virgifera virgifera]|uniref:Neuropeptide-like 3 n=1 Tax=Diabrotica virgifera virgifera TaxID=50390 RepID=A0ABM5K9L1_DIAVI|nr:uncharacterized protein LOC126884741 [Diabrotica virgifera virgifera]
MFKIFVHFFALLAVAFAAAKPLANPQPNPQPNPQVLAAYSAPAVVSDVVYPGVAYSAPLAYSGTLNPVAYTAPLVYY